MRLSLRRLQEVFQAQGTTISDCIGNMRLELARALLVNEQYKRESIGSIAYRSGFADLAHFSRRFKSRFGAPPRQY